MFADPLGYETLHLGPIGNFTFVFGLYTRFFWFSLLAMYAVRLPQIASMSISIKQSQPPSTDIITNFFLVVLTQTWATTYYS